MYIKKLLITEHVIKGLFVYFVAIINSFMNSVNARQKQRYWLNL